MKAPQSIVRRVVEFQTFVGPAPDIHHTTVRNCNFSQAISIPQPPRLPHESWKCSNVWFSETAFNNSTVKGSFRNCNFTDCDFTNVTFVDSHFFKCTFHRCNFTNAKFMAKTGSDFEWCWIDDCEFKDVYGRVIGFIGMTTVIRTDVTGANAIMVIGDSSTLPNGPLWTLADMTTPSQFRFVRNVTGTESEVREKYEDRYAILSEEDVLRLHRSALLDR